MEAPKKAAPAPKSPAAPVVPTTPSNTPAPAPAGVEHKIYVKGLPWKVEEKDVKKYFASCGKILSVELPLAEGGKSSGTAFVTFSQRSELDAAIAMDGGIWPGTERWLKIEESVERPEKKKFGSGGVKPEGCDTVFVGNLSWDVTEELVRETFGSCGEIVRVKFSEDEEGNFKGFGHVQFADGASTDEAVKLAGTELCGRAMRVDYAPPKNRDSLGGGGRGGRGGAVGGGGRGGGRGGRDGGRGGGRGRGGTPTSGNKNKGTIAIGSGGKKMTFDD